MVQPYSLPIPVVLHLQAGRQNCESGGQAIKAGANAIVAGSAIFGSPDYAATPPSARPTGLVSRETFSSDWPTLALGAFACFLFNPNPYRVTVLGVVMYEGHMKRFRNSREIRLRLARSNIRRRPCGRTQRQCALPTHRSKLVRRH